METLRGSIAGEETCDRLSLRLLLLTNYASARPAATSGAVIRLSALIARMCRAVIGMRALRHRPPGTTETLAH
jgi:hypothetical protein